jgi:NAD-dependent dihydropyrimidine dehydrogenase PreA subunit
MIRKIVQIDEDKCDGCGDCASACDEGAIQIIDGKARLVRDDYCDGLGDCLPACHVDAIKIIERKAAPFDKEAVKARQEEMQKIADSDGQESLACGCPGSEVKSFDRDDMRQTQDSCPENLACGCPGNEVKSLEGRDLSAGDASYKTVSAQSQLRQWPVQIKLVPSNAPFFNGARLLVAADCTAFAYAGFHDEFMKNHVTLIGCPKLDDADYTEKLTEIIKLNDIKSVSIVRMQVPCCYGLEAAVKKALQDSGKFIPWEIVVISTRGKIVD